MMGLFASGGAARLDPEEVRYWSVERDAQGDLEPEMPLKTYQQFSIAS